MPKFVARVEVHGLDDYKDLHVEMERRNFSRLISGPTGIFHLPSGEYLMEGDWTGEYVARKAFEAVKSLPGDRRAGVIVCEAAKHPVYEGLKPF